jgi:hypothetical protein
VTQQNICRTALYYNALRFLFYHFKLRNQADSWDKIATQNIETSEKGTEISHTDVVMKVKTFGGLLVVGLLFPGNVLSALWGSTSPVFNVEDFYEKKPMPGYSFMRPFYTGRSPFCNLKWLFMIITVRGNIPFWLSGGSTVITEEYVRLTPAVNSRTGRLWNVKVQIRFCLSTNSNLIFSPSTFLNGKWR